MIVIGMGGIGNGDEIMSTGWDGESLQGWGGTGEKFVGILP